MEEIMKVKVHWIIDGIAEMEAASLEEAERIIDKNLNEIIKKNIDFTEVLGAKSIQGKAYLPGKDEN